MICPHCSAPLERADLTICPSCHNPITPVASDAEMVASRAAPELSLAVGAKTPLTVEPADPAATRFADAEWQALLAAPRLIVDVMLALGERSLAPERVREVVAGALALTRAADSPYELIREAARQLDSGAGPSAAAEELADATLTHCRGVAAVLSAQGAPGEARAYSGWLLELARFVATAASRAGLNALKVAPREQAYLEQLALALGVSPQEG